MKRLVLAAVLIAAATPAFADKYKDSFLAEPYSLQEDYLVGYVAAHFDQNAILVGAKRPAYLTCTDMTAREVAQLMLMKIKRSGDAPLAVARYLAFSEICTARRAK